MALSQALGNMHLLQDHGGLALVSSKCAVRGAGESVTQSQGVQLLKRLIAAKNASSFISECLGFCLLVPWL